MGHSGLDLLALSFSHFDPSETLAANFAVMHNRRRPRMFNKILLRLEERAEYRGPPILEVDFPLESAVQQSLDSLLRFRPRQRGLKGGDGVEEPVGGWQRDLVDEILRRRDGAPVEGGDPARKRVDEAVQLCVG